MNSSIPNRNTIHPTVQALVRRTCIPREEETDSGIPKEHFFLFKGDEDVSVLQNIRILYKREYFLIRSI
jgi:hypothetical protein